MAVVAITSGMGTGTKYVAEKVARQLDLELVHREIWSPGRDFPLAGSSAIADPSRWNVGLARLKSSHCHEGLAILDEICRLAQRGNVLICGTTPLHFLSGAAHVVKIRIRTTMALRVRRILACMGADESTVALEKILQSDRNQSAILKRIFGIDDYETASLYDAVIDTGREPADQCAQQIVQLVGDRNQNKATGDAMTLESMIASVHRALSEVARQSRPTGMETTQCSI